MVDSQAFIASIFIGIISVIGWLFAQSQGLNLYSYCVGYLVCAVAAVVYYVTLNAGYISCKS
jgi:hypothetical protein